MDSDRPNSVTLSSIEDSIATEVKKICEQLKPLSFTERVTFELDDLYDANRVMIENIPLDSLISVEQEMIKNEHETTAPKLTDNLFREKPENKLHEYSKIPNIPTSEIVHLLRCDHADPDESIENAYVALYGEFKYNAINTKFDETQKQLVDSVTRARGFCWFARSKHELVLYLKSPLDGVNFFEQFCAYIADRVRAHGLYDKKVLSDVKHHILLIAKHSHKCKYLTAISEKSVSKLKDLSECYNRIMTAVEESRIEFNELQAKYFGESKLELELSLPVLENKLLLAVKMYESKASFEEYHKLSNGVEQKQLKEKAILIDEENELTEFIESKEKNMMTETEKRLAEDERRESFGFTPSTQKFNELRDILKKLDTELEMVEASNIKNKNVSNTKSRSRVSSSDTSYATDVEDTRQKRGTAESQVCKEVRKLRSASHSPLPKFSWASSVENPEVAFKPSTLIRNDTKSNEPENYRDFKKRMKELSDELVCMKDKLKIVENMKLINEEQNLKRQDKNPNVGHGSKVMKQLDNAAEVEMFDLTNDDDELDIQVALLRDSSSRASSRRSRASKSSSNSFITID